MFETIIAGNLDACRTEADETGTKVAVVYEDAGGWHTEVVQRRQELSLSAFHTLIENAKEALSHYINRRGENLTAEMTRGALALWLMVKVDRTAMGSKL